MLKKTDGTSNNSGSGRIIHVGADAVESLAKRLSHASPELEDLTADQLHQIAKLVIIEKLTKELGRKTGLARIDYAAERETFLTNAGRTESAHTQTGYRAGLDRIDAWAHSAGLAVLELSPKDADTYIYSLNASGLSPATIRRDVSAASSLFSFLERRFSDISNPFRGTKARPRLRAVRESAYPVQPEIDAISDTLTPTDRAAVAVMAGRGLRVGALPTLKITGNTFTAQTKGKTQTGKMPAACIAAIRAAGLSPTHPFRALHVPTLQDHFRRATAKLEKSGVINARYSVHDLRHAFAIATYSADADIYKLEKLLGHSEIRTTEHYLKGIGLLD